MRLGGVPPTLVFPHSSYCSAYAEMCHLPSFPLTARIAQPMQESVTYPRFPSQLVLFSLCRKVSPTLVSHPSSYCSAYAGNFHLSSFPLTARIVQPMQGSDTYPRLPSQLVLFSLCREVPPTLVIARCTTLQHRHGTYRKMPQFRQFMSVRCQFKKIAEQVMSSLCIL